MKLKRLYKGLYLAIALAVLLSLAIAMVLTQTDRSAAEASTVLVDNLQPSWDAAGGSVYAAYYWPNSDTAAGVSPGSTATYDGREAGIIKAGLATNPTSGNYEDEGLLGFKVNNVDISIFAGQALLYDVQNETGTNPVWVRIRLVGGTQYQFVPTTNPLAWHTVDAAAGQWQLMDENGNAIGDKKTLAVVASENPGATVDRVYLTLGIGNSYNVGPGVGTVGWIDKVTIGDVTYDFVVPTYWYVAKTGLDTNEGTLASPFLTIQHAIVSAGPGDTIHVAAGTYVEQIDIAKADLTLGGAGVGATIVQSPDVLATKFTTSAANKPIVYVHGVSGVVIKDLTVDGAGKGNANYRMEGIVFHNAGGTVQDCEIKDVRETPLSGAQHGVALYAYNQDGEPRTLNVIHNNIYGYQKNGMALSGNNLTLDVTYNTTTGAGPLANMAQNGIQLGNGATGTVSHNTSSGNFYTGSGWWAGGILLYTTTSGTVTCSDNEVYGNNYGIALYDGGGGGGAITGNDIHNNIDGIDLVGVAAVYTVTGNEIYDNTGDGIWTDTAPAGSAVNYNDIHGNAGRGVANDSATDVLDARANWWGSASGPNAATNASGTGNSVSDDVDYSPWWGANYIGVAHPWNWYMNNSNSSTIQEAIDAASGGDTINVAAGTYDEAITIDKANLTLKSETALGAIIKPTTAGTNAVYISADGVTVDGFEIDGTTVCKNGILGWETSGLTIKNNKIHGAVNAWDGCGILLFSWGNGGTVYNNLIQNNEVYDTGRMGIMVMDHGGPDLPDWGPYTVTSGNTITGNTVHDVWKMATEWGDGGGGIQINVGKDCAITNNEVYNVQDGQRGIYMFGSAAGNIITGNTLRDNPIGIQLWISGEGGTTINWGSETVTSPQVHYNEIYNNSLYGAISTNIQGTPMVMNATNNWWGDATGPDDDAGAINGSGDKISVNVDAKPWYATATTTPGTQYVTVTESPIVRAYSDTIQGGIDAAVTGNTVSVAAGTYDEQVVIGKALTLRGPNAGINPNTGTRVAEAVIRTDDLTAHQAILVSSADVTVDGFTVYGPNGTTKDIGAIGLDGTGPRTGVHIQYNRIFRTAGGVDWNCDGIRFDPPGALDASIFVEYNRISVGSETLPSGNKGNNGISFADMSARVTFGPTWSLSNARRMTIRGNYLYGHSKMYVEGIGVLIENNKFLGDWGPIEVRGSRDVVIKNNDMTNQTDVGIYAWSPKAGNSGAGLCEDIAILNNIINGMKLDPQDFTDEGTAVILGGVKNASVMGNNLSNGMGSGVVIGGAGYNHFDPAWGLAVGAYQPINNVIHGNNIQGNAQFGAKVDATVTSGIPVDATNNWWGENSGPYHPVTNPLGTGDEVSDHVLYSPWIGATKTTSTSLVSSRSPSIFGNSVTLIVAVKPTVIAGRGKPTGTVEFWDGMTLLGSKTLNAYGRATFRISSLGGGVHTITAIYRGDANFLPSASAALPQVVQTRAPSTGLRSSAYAPVHGQPVTFTAIIRSAKGTPTGTVTFWDGTTELGSAALSSGQATCTTSALSAGRHSITAVYSGDSNFTGSSRTRWQVVR